MAIGYISHHDCQLHDMGHHHPEQPARLSAINDRLIASGLEMILHQFDSVPVTRAQLEAVHDLAYIDSIYAAAPSEGLVWIDGDTAMNPHTLRAAELAAGAVALGVDLVMQGRVRQVFCVTNLALAPIAGTKTSEGLANRKNRATLGWCPLFDS